MATHAKHYYEKLRDPRWQKKRLEIMNRDEFRCFECGTTENTLSVHHGYYDRAKSPWEYPDCSLTTLCDSCHNRRQSFLTNAHRILAHLPSYELRRVTFLLAAFVLSAHRDLACESLEYAENESISANIHSELCFSHFCAIFSEKSLNKKLDELCDETLCHNFECGCVALDPLDGEQHG